MNFLDRGKRTKAPPSTTTTTAPRETLGHAAKIARHEARRAGRMARLRDILPHPLEAGTSYHFITGGDVDAIGLLELFVERHGRLDLFAGATWTMGEPDANLLVRLVREGKIGRAIVLAGGIMRNNAPAALAALTEAAAVLPIDFKLVHNHAKIGLLAAGELRVVVEGSANFSTNMNAENIILTPDAGLFDFYLNWFETVCKDNKKTAI